MKIHIEVVYTLSEKEIEELKRLNLSSCDEITRFIDKNMDMSELDNQLSKGSVTGMEF